MLKIKIKGMFLTFAFVAAIRQEVLDSPADTVTASVRDPEIGLVKFFTSPEADKDVTISTRKHKKMSMKMFLEIYRNIFERRR